jgi:glycosyltransferase involved in cell wall biosynthesis
MPEVSTIISTYNRGALLEQALDSVFSQSFRDYEVVIADDGSTDETLKRLETYGSRVRVLSLEHTGQPSVVRNRAIEAASGRFLAFLDSDDLWAPEKLALQVALMREDPELVMSYTDTAFVDARGRFLYLHSRRERPSTGRVFGRLLQRNFIALSTAMARSDVVRAVGGFEESLTMAEDWCLWLRVSTRGNVGFIADRLCTNRVGERAMTGDKAALFEDCLRALDLIEQEFPRELNDHRAGLAKGRARMMSMLARNYLFSGRAGDARVLYSKTLSNDPLRIEAIPFYALSLLGPRPAKMLKNVKRTLVRSRARAPRQECP